jgi:basic membrane lipoprotein Med (substrate-binding protein (PBP1-ABC) superfamily)
MPQMFRGAVLAALGAAAVLGATLACAADEPFKVGFVYVSPISDAGWTFQHDSGRKEWKGARRQGRRQVRRERSRKVPTPSA